MRRALVLVLLLLSDAALAEAPGRSLFPRPRPGAAPVPLSEPMSITDAAVIEAMRAAPPVRPVVEAAPVAPAAAPPAQPEAVATSLMPRSRPAGLTAPVAQARTEAPRQVQGDDSGGLCGVRGLTGRRVGQVSANRQGCGVDDAVRISAVQGISLSEPATLNCDTARAFDRWVREAMLPALGDRGGGVSQIVVGSHYACRTRNNQRGARLSEHARGNAIDVMGFRMVNGDRVTVEDDFRRGRYRRAMQRMHEDACGIFRTTLGPGSDRFHENHFHYDLARHRGGGTYCR